MSAVDKRGSVAPRRSEAYVECLHRVTGQLGHVLTSPHSLPVGGCSGGVQSPALLDGPVCRLSKPLWCRRKESRQYRACGGDTCTEPSTVAAGELKVGEGLRSGVGHLHRHLSLATLARKLSQRLFTTVPHSQMLNSKGIHPEISPRIYVQFLTRVPKLVFSKDGVGTTGYHM